MQRVAYTNRPLPQAPKIYCDTSFLLDLFAQARLAGNPPLRMTGSQRQRVLHVRSFFHDARQNGSVFVSSVFAMEESFQKLLFEPVYSEMKSHVPTFRTWKDLQAGDAAAFARAIGVGRTLVQDFDAFIHMEGIEILAFGKQAQVTVLEYQVISFAKEILRLYETESMDAFHYAVMRRFGIGHAASSDLGWLRFPNGTLVTTN